MNDKSRKPRPMGLSTGSPSIMMLFAVLCLTVLSALSLLSANSRLSISERAADVARSYYDAELRAADIFDRVLRGDESALDEADTVSRDYYGSGISWVIVTYTVAMSDRQSLQVRYTVTSDEITLDSWRLVESGVWEADDILILWDDEW